MTTEIESPTLWHVLQTPGAVLADFHSRFPRPPGCPCSFYSVGGVSADQVAEAVVRAPARSGVILVYAFPFVGRRQDGAVLVLCPDEAAAAGLKGRVREFGFSRWRDSLSGGPGDTEPDLVLEAPSTGGEAFGAARPTLFSAFHPKAQAALDLLEEAAYGLSREVSRLGVQPKVLPLFRIPPAWAILLGPAGEGRFRDALGRIPALGDSGESSGIVVKVFASPGDQERPKGRTCAIIAYGMDFPEISSRLDRDLSRRPEVLALVDGVFLFSATL